MEVLFKLVSRLFPISVLADREELLLTLVSSLFSLDTFFKERYNQATTWLSWSKTQLVDFSAPGNYAIDSELESQDGDVASARRPIWMWLLWLFHLKKKRTHGCEGLQVLIGSPTYRLAAKAYSSHYMGNALPWADGQPGEGMPDMQRLS